MDWLAAREAELLPVPYYHLVFTIPAALSDIAYQNKAVIYDILFKTSAKTVSTIAGDGKHLGARVGMISVLHTWGSAMTHHPHVHMIVPGGGLGEDGERWIACKPGFFLPVRVLSRLFRRLFLEALQAAHKAGKLNFFSRHTGLYDAAAFEAYLDPWRKADWVVYAKRPFAGPQQVLSYLARYTHRIAIANSRLSDYDGERVSFKYKDYRKQGKDRYRIMTLEAHEFIRRFLIHVLPTGFHRIRHYGLFANGGRKKNLNLIRQLLNASASEPEPNDNGIGKQEKTEDDKPAGYPCPTCGEPMTIIETFEAGQQPLSNQSRAPPRDRTIMSRQAA